MSNNKKYDTLQVIQLESALYQRQQYIEELLEMVASNDTERKTCKISCMTRTFSGMMLLSSPQSQTFVLPLQTFQVMLCNSISHLPDLAKGFHKKTEFKQLSATVDKMRSRLDELKKAGIKYQDELKDSYKKAIAEIKALRMEIDSILNQLEKATIEQIVGFSDFQIIYRLVRKDNYSEQDQLQALASITLCVSMKDPTFHTSCSDADQPCPSAAEEDLQDILYDQDVVGSDAIVMTTEPGLCDNIAEFQGIGAVHVKLVLTGSTINYSMSELPVVECYTDTAAKFLVVITVDIQLFAMFVTFVN
ncbi:hypothetical protein MAR_008526 [Mya arenaria]|uniref:Uncharacterized protein n=1 Tax=Mya arenaria TaxID=6604 RepID=A0ABY7DW78_MYAAR|nr:hypothetical protein MAR_008526 [Mya arenaria]